jgi:hypothetical protein
MTFNASALTFYRAPRFRIAVTLQILRASFFLSNSAKRFTR